MASPVLEEASALWDQGIDWSEVLQELRERGYSVVDSIKATRETLRLPLREAKRIVHTSEAWADARQDFEAFHSSIVEGLAETLAADDPTRELAEGLLGVVTALRHGRNRDAHELLYDLESSAPSRHELVLLTAGLAAALAEMGEFGNENLLEALAFFVLNERRVDLEGDAELSRERRGADGSKL